MKSYLACLIICLTISADLYSQKEGRPINYRFTGGEANFISFFSKNISLPEQVVANGVFGNSITRISLDPKGEIKEITIINPIDTIVDIEVLRVIDLSKKFWRKHPKIDYDQVFYIQVAFSITKFLPNMLRPDAFEIRKLFPEPIIITLRNPRHVFQKNEDILASANAALASERFEDALSFYNELIKRDPFNRDLYKVRIMINIKLNRPELVNGDDEKLFNFAEGYSLDDLIKSQKYPDAPKK
jgi:hypothetical protein